MQVTMKDLAKVFKALADDTRLMMLGLILKHGEQCVCAFEEGLGISQSKSSRHLRYLYNAGLLDDRRNGTWIYYRIKENPSDETTELLRLLRTLLTGEKIKAAEKRLKEWARCCKTQNRKPRSDGNCSHEQKRDSSRHFQIPLAAIPANRAGL